MKIVFATNNESKLREVRDILGNRIDVLSLSDIGCHEDIPETGARIEDNARQKAAYVFDKYGYDCFADDTGLEVYALGGEPGVYSARYAEGTSHDSNANMSKLLRKMDGASNRRARFRTAICVMLKQNECEPARCELFEGIVNGTILTEKRGTAGFGYDPLFMPDGYDKTFAELGDEVKNGISHRARAVKKLADFLLSL